MRKPIQIAAFCSGRKDENGGQESNETEVVALCDDGTIWTMLGMSGEWVPLPRIPQTPVLEDWLEEVAKYLPSRSIRRDAIASLVKEHRGMLVEKFNAGEAAKDAGDALVARLG
jgi:hypothetical protein